MTAVTGERVAALLGQVRERHPLIHNITNIVTPGDVANLLLALGAAPVMAHAPEEVEEMAAQAGALVLNIGTLTAKAIDAMILAGRRANERGIPVILDPVGAGATSFRSTEALRILAEVRVGCIRGNAGEIASLAGQRGTVRGVDATGVSGGVGDLARHVARQTEATIAATGVEDVVTDGTRTVLITNGHPLLARITGSGCMASAAVGAFAAVEPDMLVAAVAGLVCFEVAAERAAEVAAGPGTFRAALIDAVANLETPDIVARARVRTL